MIPEVSGFGKRVVKIVDKSSEMDSFSHTMSLSTLDPKTALIVIDLQKRVVSLPLVHPLTEVVSNARARKTRNRWSGALISAVIRSPSTPEIVQCACQRAGGAQSSGTY
jgi:hypothetical protein